MQMRWLLLAGCGDHPLPNPPHRGGNYNLDSAGRGLYPLLGVMGRGQNRGVEGPSTPCIWCAETPSTRYRLCHDRTSTNDLAVCRQPRSSRKPRDTSGHMAPNEFRMVQYLVEGRRIEFKSLSKVNFDGISEYLSMYSNTSDGGVLLLGVENDGTITGCSKLGTKKLNDLEKIQVRWCPQARPEFKRIPLAEGSAEFFYAVFVPYIGVLVENKNGDAFIRYGDSKHRLSEPEKDDFRSTRHERAFERRPCDLKYPDEFDTEILDEFCRKLTVREPRPGWSREEILADRLLGEKARMDRYSHSMRLHYSQQRYHAQ